MLTSSRKGPDLMITSRVFDVNALVARHVESAGSAGSVNEPGALWPLINERRPNRVS
jgi:hypothetical protein